MCRYHQPHQLEESLMAQGSFVVRVWKGRHEFSLFPEATHSVGYSEQHGAALHQLTLGCKPATALEAGQVGAQAGTEKQVEESVPSFQTHRLLVGRGTIIIIMHTESSLKQSTKEMNYLSWALQQTCMLDLIVNAFYNPVEINKDQLHVHKSSYLFKACIARNQPPSLVFGADSKASREMGNFITVKRGGFGDALHGGC